MYKKGIRIFLFTAALILPIFGYAQSSGLNTFSPYTMYGLGDLEQGGTTATNSMGGIGAALWDPYSVNIMNPASHGAVVRNSFIFSFGLSGKQSYLKDNSGKTAYNGFNINDIAVKFPLYKGIGLSVSMTPYSSIGYEIEHNETNEDILTDLGLVKYFHTGEGGITQFKLGVGFKVFERLSLGADLIYYLGTITREYGQQITPVNSTESYGSASIRNRHEVSRLLFDVGLQFDIIRNSKRFMTLGATYQPKVTMDDTYSREFGSTGSSDSIYYSETKLPVKIPGKISAGIFYRTEKLGIGFDYTYQDWKNFMEVAEKDNVSFSKVNSYNFGLEFTPNRLDIRSVLKRWTYRAGFKYMDMYTVKNNHDTSQKAITFGVGIPLKMAGFSAIDVGVEVGQRGTTKYGLVKHNYFKISVGLSLFGDDEWFVKRKYY
ncbi:MAG: outer membrane protein transport protein [Rikenellaceae bacterium]|nr:outer membrane protein transport protein [Rikenellaceae bacterium]